MITIGLIYPILMTGFAKIFFPSLANGSLIIKNEKLIGSELIGQYFIDPKHFQSRPSATNSFPYNTMASGGSNLGPNNPNLIKNIKDKIEKLNRMESTISPNKIEKHDTPPFIPIDLITASGSGLDPHLSPKAALYQVPRIAKLHQLPENVVADLVYRLTEKPQLGFLGAPRVNVLKLNLALDELSINKKITNHLEEENLKRYGTTPKS